ncbi:DUF327 family protein [Ornithinibacillus gellani]|uniref:YaaR family protein n=1 Tax=Ornithinibacillus gellani TaxID=2293253 RepID=UPI000F4A409E|nr:YaaR family protein [Ornithinibacillus gellani]TQS76390.1 DUF327 family protein [Ornithinibacillus gellani]
MKVNQDMRTQLDTIQRNTRTTGEVNTSFKGLVQSHTNKLGNQELQRLVQEITVQGNKLARYRSLRDLVKFKRLVKGFLEEAVSNGLELKQNHHFSLSGESRNLTIIQEIDEKLLQLTEEIMSHEKKSVDLLGLIGEIKGLLVNLYM